MSVVNADLCAVVWGAGGPPPPPSPGSFSPPPNLGGNPYNVAGSNSGGIRFSGALNNAYLFIGELINDNQSSLIGAIVNEIDVSLKKVGSPTGYIQVAIFQGNGAQIAGSNSVDVSQLTLGFVNYKFPVAYGGVPTPYSLQVGDRVCLYWTSGNYSGSDYVMIDINKNDAFDGNHTVLAGFTATGIYPSGGAYGVWQGWGGKWTVLIGQDLAGSFFS